MTRVLAERRGDEIVLEESAYADKDMVKLVPGATWDRRSERWKCRLSWPACLALRGVFGERLQVGPQLTEWSIREWEDWIEPALTLRLARTPDTLPAFKPDSRAFRVLEALNRVEDELESRGLLLYPFQRTGVAFLALGVYSSLLDEMGSGKTPQTVVAMRVCHELGGDVLPGVVFCPSAMRHTWKREIEKWWPGVRAAVVAGSAAKRRRLLEDAEHDFYCLNWESARLHSRLAPYGSTAMTDKEKEPKELQALRPRTVVADEAHALRNASKQTRAVWATGHQDSVAYRFALTGTPIADTPADAWGLLHFLDPDEHPGRTRYVDRYVETTYDWAGYLVMGGLNPATKDEFFRATDPRTRRVTKAEAMPHLPPIIPETRVVEMSDKQAKAYKQIRDSQLTALDGGVLTVTNGLDALTRLSQFASSYAEVSYAEECRHKVPVGQPCTSCAGDVALPAEIVTLVEPSNKVDAMEELLEELGPTEPLVVCAASRQLIELAERRLDHLDVSHVSVKGGQTADFRQAQVDAFQEGKSRVMLFTLQAGGTGLTLTRARVMAILQGSWDAIQMSQARARVHREGSQVHENVLIIEYVSDKTVELGRLEALAGKGDRLEEVVRDQEALRNFFLQGDEAPKQRRAPRRRKKPEPPPVLKRCPVADPQCPYELEGTDPCGSISCWGEGPVEVDPDTDETKEDPDGAA